MPTSGNQPIRSVRPGQVGLAQAEQAMDGWTQTEHVWEQTKQAMRLFPPAGHLNTREQAEGVLANPLEQLPEADFAKTKRQLRKPEMLNYLDRVQTTLAALPYAEEVKQAAVRQEGLRRQRELLRGNVRKRPPGGRCCWYVRWC